MGWEKIKVEKKWLEWIADVKRIDQNFKNLLKLKCRNV